MQTGEYDFAYYVLMEEDLLRRLEQGAAKGRILTIPSPAVSFIQLNHSDPWTEVDGERSSPRSTHPFLSDPAVRAALGLLVDRASIQEHLVGRTGQITANFLNAPERFRSPDVGVQRRQGQPDPRPGGMGARGGRHPRQGRQAPQVLYQAAANATVQKVQMVVKQAAARAGIEIEVKAVQASVFFASDVNNPDTNVRFLADLQTYTTFTGLDPQGFMAQFVSWEIPSRENKWTGRNIARWRNADFDRLWRQAEVEMDPVKRAALFIRMNDLVVQTGRGDPDHVAQRAARRGQLARRDRVQWLGLDLRQHRLLVPPGVAPFRALAKRGHPLGPRPRIFAVHAAATPKELGRIGLWASIAAGPPAIDRRCGPLIDATASRS